MASPATAPDVRAKVTWRDSSPAAGDPFASSARSFANAATVNSAFAGCWPGRAGAAAAWLARWSPAAPARARRVLLRDRPPAPWRCAARRGCPSRRCRGRRCDQLERRGRRSVAGRQYLAERGQQLARVVRSASEPPASTRRPTAHRGRHRPHDRRVDVARTGRGHGLLQRRRLPVARRCWCSPPWSQGTDRHDIARGPLTAGPSRSASTTKSAPWVTVWGRPPPERLQPDTVQPCSARRRAMAVPMRPGPEHGD